LKSDTEKVLRSSTV